VSRETISTEFHVKLIFDIYGRGLITEAAAEAGSAELNPSQSRSEAHSRIDPLRNRNSSIADNNDFEKTLRSAGTKVFDERHKSAS
jgi:hypothetical protein